MVSMRLSVSEESVCVPAGSLTLERVTVYPVMIATTKEGHIGGLGALKG